MATLPSRSTLFRSMEMTSLGVFLVGSVVFFFMVLDDDGLRRRLRQGQPSLRF